MALKNLFEMAKADRYTADGREAIIKAQEEETEDKVYQIGEISQKTGLQKTANGWVKPKNGKQPGAKTGEGKSPSAGSINRTPERIKKETAIMEALNLSTEEDNNLHKMSDETIERLYKKAMSDTPAPKKENPTRTFTFNAGPDGKPVPGTGKQVQTFKTKEEAQKALNIQNAVAKYKNLPGPQRKDALFASTFEGISIGLTQNSMERQGWDLIQADDQVNVYGKPDGSKATMKHDGKKITEVNYEAPGSKPAESKPAAENNLSDIPEFKGMESGDYDKKLRAEGWTTGGWEGNGTHASAIFKKGDRTIRVNEGQPGKITSVQEISKPAEKLPAKPTRGMSESYIRGTQLMKPAEDESQRGEQHWAGVLSGYDNTSVIEQRKQLQEKYDEFEEDIKDYDRRGLAPAVYAKRINQQNFIKGALKAIDDEMENRGMDPAPRTSVPDSAPRVLTGDTRIRVRKA